MQRRQQHAEQNNGNNAPGVNTYRMPEDEEDRYEDEILAIAEVTSYFQICYKRAIDVIPMLIETELLQKFSISMSENLIANLGLTGEGGLESCARFATEDDQVRQQREKLERKKATLEEATVILRTILNT